MNFISANTYCENTFDTHLATVTSFENLVSIRHCIVTGGINVNNWLLIGANDLSSEGNFEWFDGTPISYYNNWGNGEPNNYNGNEDCTEMYASLLWNDAPCTSRNEKFICNYPRYIGVNIDKSYSDANSYCLSNYGTTLATITNRDEILFALDAAYTSGIPQSIHDSPWFGLNDINNEGSFTWIDGSVNNYVNWASNEPNNDNNQDCGKLYIPNGDWDDDYCTYTKPFICNFPKYIGVTTRTTWSNANTYCQNNFGTKLATITSNADNSDVRNAATFAGISSNDRIWIGLTDTAQEGTWIWTENNLGVTNLYNNWGSGQPNNLGSGQDCAAMVASTNKWDDRECNGNSYAFVCNAPQYIAVSQKLTYSNANSYCLSTFGTTLATIFNSEMNDIVRYSATAIGISTSENLWIGLSDQNSEGNFVWQDGTSLGYTNWNSGEPNNSGNEDCTEMYSTGKWNDKDCSQTRYFVCNL